MLDLALLEAPIPGESLGIDTLDPRFQDVAALVEQGQYAEAGAKCQETFAQQAWDVRLLAWFYFGTFLQHGVAGLAPVFRSATRVFTESWPTVKPEAKQDKHSVVALAWFLGKLADRLKAAEDEKGEDWNRWRAEVKPEDLTATLEALARLREAFTTVVPNSAKFLDQLPKVEDWLRGFEAQVAAPPPAEPEAPPAEAATEASPAEGASARPAAATASGAPGVEGSFRLAELVARMAAFDDLVRRGDLAKAAIVAADVSATIEQFDPRLYFPRLFATFYGHLVARAPELQGWIEKKGSLSWSLFEQLYRTDLDGFVGQSEQRVEELLSSSLPGSSASSPPSAGFDRSGGSPDDSSPPQDAPPPESPPPIQQDTGW